nr:hypothetical protein [Tanacetum cinerariifolium]
LDPGFCRSSNRIRGFCQLGLEARVHGMLEERYGSGFGTVRCRVREVDDRGIMLGFWAGKFVSSVRSREITPIYQAHQFVSPLSGDAIMDFVNELGYTKVIHFVLSMAVNNLYQPWREMPSMINQCLTGKTLGFDRLRYPVLQMLWGIITSINIDYDELLWEEFVQAIQTFLTDKANLGSPTKKGIKDKPYVIPYYRSTKLIICHLGRIHNIHQRSTSLFHLAEEDLKLEKEGKKKPITAKQPKLKPAVEKSSKPAPIPKPKATKEKPAKPSPVKPSKMGKVLKTRKGKSSL